jgi:hypothetical protein
VLFLSFFILVAKDIGGDGGWWIEERGGMLRRLQNHRDVNPLQAPNPSNTTYYIIHHVAF